MCYHLVRSQNAVWGGFVALFLVYFAGLGFTWFFLKKKMEEEPGKWTWKSIIYEISLRNIMELRAQLSSTIGFLPNIWAYMMKQFIPQVILILFINLAQSNNDDGDSLFGNYGGYADWPFQILGCVFCFLCSNCRRPHCYFLSDHEILTQTFPWNFRRYGVVLFSLSLFLIGFVFPDLYSGLSLLDEKAIIHGYGAAQKVEEENSGKKLEDETEFPPDKEGSDDSVDEVDVVDA